MRIIKEKNKNFSFLLKKLIEPRVELDSNKIDLKVKKIIKEVRTKGDKSLIKLTKKFDNNNITEKEFLIPKNIRNNYKKKIDKNVFKSFKLAIKNIKNFHKKQFPKNYELNKNELITGIKWKSIQEVALYVPGGNASYPSSLLMNIIPAQIAGVKRIVVTMPGKNGNFNPYLLALLDFLKIKEVYQLGGAQAIAALAYGTETIKPVNKIFGPGNAYVTSAKKQVFGKVGIDLIAGPSEIVVVADSDNNPNWVASDLIAQAEHDKNSQCILITDDLNFAYKVEDKIKYFSNKLYKKETINKSLNTNGAIIVLKDLSKANQIIDFIAPEHVHLQNKSSINLFKKLKNAGCVFMGIYTPEAFGDYIVGTNHILPTSGSSKYSSGLGVLDFMKRTSYIRLNQRNFENLSKHVSNIASIENLDGHKLSVTIRQNKKKNIRIK